MSDSTADRLVLFRVQRQMTQDELALSLGVSRATVGHIESGARTPSKSFLVKLSDTYGINADWLLNGHGEMQRQSGPGFGPDDLRIEPPIPGKPLGGDLTIGGTSFALVRRFDLAVSAGNGLVPASDDATDRFAFPVEWLRRLGVVGDLAALVPVQGDSMAPTIPDGSLVLIDARENTVSAAGIYAFTLDGEAFVKRLLATPQGKTVTMISDNPAFAPRAISGPQLAHLRIAGRVRFVMHPV